MIGNVIVDPKTGLPLDNQGNKLSPSSYQPGEEVRKLFARCQQDYSQAWRLQHRNMDEFDGHSLLERANLDQKTFGAFVGAEWVPEHKRWRWKGRKNTARNKLIGILAHMLAGMLYPLVHAQNEENEEDKMTAKVMRIIVEEHLRKADYEMKFLYMVLSALVNPAVIVKIEYVEAFQKVKQQLANGQVKITEVIDEFLCGILLRIMPIDQLLIADLFTPEIQIQPHVIEIDRIPWDTARKIYAGRHFVDGKDQFDYVEAGKTRVFLAGQEHQVLYDIEWTEADRNYVQVIKCMYRDEDLEVVWVGGVLMGEYKDVYNRNPFKHRRLSLIGDEWISIPIYPYAKSFFEPIDPTGRFFYGKSGAFKEYWDDQTQNKMHQLLIDGTYLDVFKPSFLTGLAKVDSTVIAPGAVIGMPAGASVSQYSLGPNLPAAMQALQKQETDMSESTQDKIMGGQTTAGVTATQSIQAQNQARIFLGVFGIMIAHLIRQIGELVVDCTVQHTTTAELDATVPGTLRMKEKVMLAKGKDKGKDITNRIVFTDKFMGKKMTQAQKDDYEWKLWKDAGGEGSDQAIYHVNPYKFARMKYSMYVDPDQITNAAMGNDRMQKMTWYQMMIQPNIAPFTDPKAVADEIIEEFTIDSDPDRFKNKASVHDIMSGMMSGGQQQNPQMPQMGQQPGQPQNQMLNNMQ